MLVGAAGGDPPARRALEEAQLKQERLVDILDRIDLLGQRGRQRREADRPAVEQLDDRPQQPAVVLIQPQLVDLQLRQRQRARPPA